MPLHEYQFNSCFAEHIEGLIEQKNHLGYVYDSAEYNKFLKFQDNTPPPDIIGWIQRFLSVDKSTERSFPRSLRGIGAVSFFYRAA